MRYKTPSRLNRLSENSQNDEYNILMTPFYRFCQADPARFRVGDIVEAQITIAAVPMRNDKFKMICQLRSLALLDGAFADVSKSSCGLSYFEHQTNKIIKASNNKQNHSSQPPNGE